MNTASPRELAARQVAVTKLMRKYGDLMTPQAYEVVMQVAIHPGITMQELEKATDLSLASVSRNLMALGKYHRLGKPGLYLIETADDPTERRRKIAFLTPKGRKFVEDVISVGLPASERVEFEAPTATEFLNRSYRGR